MSLLANGLQMDLARLQEGAALALRAPHSETVRVAYKWEIPGQTLSGGTAEFTPGQMLQWILPPANTPPDSPLLRLAITTPDGIPWDGPANIYLVKTAPASEALGVMLLGKGSQWKYNDSVSNAVPGWFSTVYSDAAWRQGAAPLGYGNTPKEATTVSYGSDSGHKYITTFFRNPFSVTNAAGFEGLTFNLLRDDGAILYLNGVELYRENMPAGGTTFSTTASTNNGGTATVFSSTTIHSAAPLLQDGTNIVAVEIHQYSGSSSDILFDLEILGNPAAAPGALPPLYWGKFDRDDLALVWGDSSWQLEQAENVEGPYTLSPMATPAVLTTTNRQVFYRLRK